jgi:peptidoglycan hydrolase-like protein with peptidoglycan-binding domain
MAATPGTSNHGLGLAIDLAWYDSSQILGITARMDVFNWLLLNAFRYGFSWETQSEPWHIRYVAGDSIPQAVLDFEHGPVTPPPVTPPPVTPPVTPPVDPPHPERHAGTPLPVLQKGSTGDQAFALINMLKFWGWYPAQYKDDANDGVIGDRGDQGIRNMQGALHITVDGNYGTQSAAALSAFLFAMDAANKPDPLAELAAYANIKLANNEAPDHNGSGTGELKAGDPRNRDAYLLQVICNRFAGNGAIPGCGNPDGLFGGMTAASVKRLQEVYLNINPGDGKYGPVSHLNLQMLMNNLAKM